MPLQYESLNKKEVPDNEVPPWSQSVETQGIRPVLHVPKAAGIANSQAREMAITFSSGEQNAQQETNLTGEQWDFRY